MRFIQMVAMRLRALLHGEAVDREFAGEMGEHLEQFELEYIARGMTPDAARAAARRRGDAADRLRQPRQPAGRARASVDPSVALRAE